MKILIRLAGLLLLIAMSNSAMAEWIRVSDSSYFDPSSVRKTGNIVRVWELIDLKEPNTTTPEPFLSAKVRREYDCKGEIERLIYIVYFPRNMGEGTALHTDKSPSEWAPIVPGSGGEATFKFACGKDQSGLR